MSHLSPTDATRRYVDLSNAADLDAALAMFAQDAVYGSSQVGAYTGRDEIEAMMRAFFARYPRPHWSVAEYRAVSADEAEFEFVMTGTDGETGAAIERRGTERIAFDAHGLIRRVVVAVRE